MNRSEVERYAKKLEASGIQFSRGELDGSGNRVGLVDIPWEAALLQIIRLTGWCIVEEVEESRDGVAGVLPFPPRSSVEEDAR
jgi:hypothetical protein